MKTEPRSNTEIIISALHIIARDLEFTESAAVFEAASRLEELDQQVRKLQGDNKALVSQNQYLRQRPDLPVDRIPAYKKHAEQIKQLENARNEHLDHLKQICEIVGEVENGKHDIGVAWESVAAIKHHQDELAAHSDRLLRLLREHYYDFEYSDGLTDWDEEDWHGRVGFALEDKASHSLAEVRANTIEGIIKTLRDPKLLGGTRLIGVSELQEHADRARKEAQ
ncbi:hypothetical protein [Oceanimonas smirnovii]|uniref:hypothetical protein n=1 Tax=Oceanimonas smirnovii TaxID=264574 RepID=UPI003FCFCF50